MAVSIPDTLTANSSERYILSIRISSDGFSFSGTIPDKRNSFFYRQITFDRSKDYATSLKDAFFEEECLSWTYKKINIHCFTTNYLCIPEVFYDDNKKDEAMQYAFLAPTEIGLSNQLLSGKNRILFSIEKEVYGFLSRSFVNPEFIHHLTYPCNTWKRQSELSFSGQTHVILNRKTIDIACSKRGELVFLNSFDYTAPDDALYFISYVWKQTEMNQLKDRLFIFGHADYKKDLIASLKNYIHYVSEMELPTDAYLRNPEIMQAPYDIILSVCE
jgi:hypothetical protein